MLRLGRGFLLSSGLGCCPTRTVKAGAAAGIPDDLSVDISVVNHRCIHSGHGPVVTERIPVPSAAIVAVSSVAPAVIDSAVESDGRPPVALVKEVIAAVVTPVSRSPHKSDARRKDPGARDPVITGIVGPVAGSPN